MVMQFVYESQSLKSMMFLTVLNESMLFIMYKE